MCGHNSHYETSFIQKEKIALTFSIAVAKCTKPEDELRRFAPQLVLISGVRLPHTANYLLGRNYSYRQLY